MSAMTSAMSPAIAPPIALSAEYLRWGADYSPESLARTRLRASSTLIL